MKLKTPEQIGEHIKKLLEKQVKEDGSKFTQSDLAEAMANFANSDRENGDEDFKKEKFKDSISKWIRGVNYPGIESIYYLSRILRVSVENILSAGEVNEKYDDRRVTLYSMGKTHDKSLMEKFCEQNPEVFSNYDEFGKTLLDYVLEFENYEALKYLIDKNIVGMFNYNDSNNPAYILLSFVDFPKYYEIIKILVKHDDVERFLKFYDGFTIVNASAISRKDDRFGIYSLKFDDEILDMIYNSTQIFNYLINEHTNTKRNLYPRISRTIVDDLPSLSGFFNILLKMAINKNDSKKMEHMLKIGLEHNNKVVTAIFEDFTQKYPNTYCPYFIDEDFCLLCNRYDTTFVNILAGVSDDVANKIKDEQLRETINNLNLSLEQCGKKVSNEKSCV